MNNRLALAIRNNHDLYKAVFTAQGIKSQRSESIWYCLEKTPPLYSNLVTRSEDWTPDKIFDSIDARFILETWAEWSIKDSFNVLDLSDSGFKRLFYAQWVYLEASRFTPVKTEKSLSYEIIRTEDQLSGWRNAWDSNEQLGKEIFKGNLLVDPQVEFVAGYDGRNIVSGCLLNRTEDAFGISNFFAPSGSIKYWNDLISFVFGKIESCDLVGYEQKDVINKLSELGFESIGKLSVWLKSSPICPS